MTETAPIAWVSRRPDAWSIAVPGASDALRPLAEQAFSRTAGAPLISGNSVRILHDATENYPAWLEAIRSAERWVHFESYIIANDATGREFVEALAAKARSGVRVRLIYDWLGTPKLASRRLWRTLATAGAEVRCFNPPRFERPLSWLSRDHRKMIGVDGRVGYVTGLCVSSAWRGNPERGVEPWRDIGVEIRGPAVGDIEAAFSQVWAATGATLPEEEQPIPESIPPVGQVGLRVIATAPNTAGLYRLDQLIAAMARKTLWLTDAYFVGVATYVQALLAAAADGVDVRLLLPGASDIPLLKPMTRAGYRILLEGGIRIFEWNGSMLHAKTAVADGRWARVGSTNLNLASWLGNYELDVAVEDEGFAQAMERTYQEDLQHATEIVLSEKRKVRPAGEVPVPRMRGRRGSSGRAAAGALRLANTVGAAISHRPFVGTGEVRVLAVAGVLLLILAVISLIWPLAVAVPLAVVAGWAAVVLWVRAWRLRRLRSRTP
jgi:cardiolipin synthase A/B